MPSLLLSESHALGKTVSDLGLGVATNTSPRTIVNNVTGVTVALSATSSLQTVYYCADSVEVLMVVCLDTASRTVYTAQSSSPTPTVGIVTSKPTPTNATVVAYGPVSGFVGLVPGNRYFLSHDGTITTPPLDPEDAQYVHPVGLAIDETTLFAMPEWARLKRHMDDDAT